MFSGQRGQGAFVLRFAGAENCDPRAGSDERRDAARYQVNAFLSG